MRLNFWFQLTWWDGHADVQNISKMSLKFCIISNRIKFPKDFFRYCYINMAAVTSSENRGGISILVGVVQYNDKIRFLTYYVHVSPWRKV